MNLARSIIGVIVGVAFIWIGAAHFKNPKAFNEIVPNYLGAPYFWTYASGLFEIALGVGLLIPAARMASPKEIASYILNLSTETNTYITGQTIAVSGGE